MSRIGLLNLTIGFWLVFFAAAAGAFIGTETESAFVFNQDKLLSWQLTLIKSAHAHTNLFGILHICLGLTLPYCQMPKRNQLLETVGLSLGSFAMSCLLLIKSFTLPQTGINLLGIIIGSCLSFALLALFHHGWFLTRRLGS